MTGFASRLAEGAAMAALLSVSATLGCGASSPESPSGLDGGAQPADATAGGSIDGAAGNAPADGSDASDAATSNEGTDSATTACTGSGVSVPAAERVSNGNPLLPPKWAFGILWGSYYDQVGSTFAQGGDILTAASQLRAQYSGDLMWIDSSWLWHNYSGDPAGTPDYINFTFDSTTFPDPATMIQTLQQNHFHFGVWEWPWMDHGCEYFQNAVTNKYFIMNGANPALASGGWHGDPNPAEFDFTNPATVAWWTGLNTPLSAWGLDFLKLDTTVAQQSTPITGSGGKYFDPVENYQAERNGAAYAVTKLYPASHDPDAMMNGARGFIMAKAGSPNNDQLPGWWTDDTDATWAYMATEMSRASQLDTPETAAYWCGDTGGYNGVPSDELYIRWLEYTAFTPLQEFLGERRRGSARAFRGSSERRRNRSSSSIRTFVTASCRSGIRTPSSRTKSSRWPIPSPGSGRPSCSSATDRANCSFSPSLCKGRPSASVKFPAGAAWIDYWTGRRLRRWDDGVGRRADRRGTCVRESRIHHPHGPRAALRGRVRRRPVDARRLPRGVDELHALRGRRD